MDRAIDKEAMMEERVSQKEIEAEDAVSLPNKEVLSLLDVNANVDLGLDLAAPVDLAAAANLNVAAPIEASAAANVLSSGAQAVGYAEQHGSIDQTLSGTADATAPLLLVFALAVASAGFHELGHASACRYGGATPGGMGMGMYLVWPAF